MDSTQRVEIKAKFLPILRWTVTFAVALVVVVVFISWLNNSDSTGSSRSSEETILLSAQIIGWGAIGIIGFALFLYGITRFTGVCVTANEISGRSYWGFKVRFPPESVTKVTETRNQGVRYLWVSSDESSKQLCLVLLGVQIEEYVDDLSLVIGSDNELTKWFSSSSQSDRRGSL